jgi:hypothetical protein
LVQSRSCSIHPLSSPFLLLEQDEEFLRLRAVVTDVQPADCLGADLGGRFEQREESMTTVGADLSKESLSLGPVHSDLAPLACPSADERLRPSHERGRETVPALASLLGDLLRRVDERPRHGHGPGSAELRLDLEPVPHVGVSIGSIAKPMFFSRRGELL